MAQPLVDTQQPVIGQGRVRHRQAGRPPGPHRLGRQSAGQQHARVHRLRRRADHRRGHRPGRHVDHPGQLHPAGNLVIEQDQHVQRGGVDLHQLARRRRVSLGELPLRPACQPAAGGRRPGRVLSRRQPGEQPEHRGPRRLQDGLPSLGEDLAGPPDNERRRPRRLIGRLRDRLLHRPGNCGIGPPGQAAPRWTRLSTSPGRPSACHRCRRCLTVEAATGRPGTDSSAAFACSRSARLVRSPSYAGRGGAPAGASGGVPSTTSMMWASHHRARSTASGGSPPSPVCAAGCPPGPRGCSRIRPLPTSSATAASSTAPSSSANRISGPEAPSTTRGRPSMMTRSPALTGSAVVTARPRPGPATPSRRCRAGRTCRWPAHAARAGDRPPAGLRPGPRPAPRRTEAACPA